MRPLIIILVLAIALPVAASERAPADQTPAVADLILEGLDAPLRVRLIATFDDIPWADRIDRLQRQRAKSLFHQLDADGDGRLTREEAKRMPAQNALSQSPHSERHVAFNFLVLDADRDGAATLEELADYLAIFSGPPFQLIQHQERHRPQAPDLFSLLDADRDGRLTPGEWSAADALMERDRDGNRVLTPDELQRPAAGALGPEFVAVPLSRGLKGRPLTLKVAEVSTTSADVTILVRFTNSPDWAKAVRAPAVDVALGPAADRLGVRVRQTRPDAVDMEIDRRRIKLRLLPSTTRRERQLQQAIVREFEAAAQRSDGAVRFTNELPPLLKPLFWVTDHDANGTLTRSELDGCLESFVADTLAVEASRLRMIVSEERGGLFSLADQNADGRLSQREIARLPEVTAACGASAEGVTREDIATTISLQLQRGPFDGAMNATSHSSLGPPWFHRADRNQDGVLDALEFLGPPDLFHQLDLDGDGWIDLSEAVAADALLHKEPPESEALP